MTEYDILKTSQENFTAFFSLGSTSKIAIDFVSQDPILFLVFVR